jgi:hypothetical protein
MLSINLTSSSRRKKPVCRGSLPDDRLPFPFLSSTICLPSPQSLSLSSPTRTESRHHYGSYSRRKALPGHDYEDDSGTRCAILESTRANTGLSHQHPRPRAPASPAPTAASAADTSLGDAFWTPAEPRPCPTYGKLPGPHSSNWSKENFVFKIFPGFRIPIPVHRIVNPLISNKRRRQANRRKSAFRGSASFIFSENICFFTCT